MSVARVEAVAHAATPLALPTTRDELPDHLWLAVFRLLGPRDLARAALVSSDWARLARTGELWRRHWMDEMGQPTCCRLSSNEMGGCAIQLRSDGDAEATRAQDLLLRRPAMPPLLEEGGGAPLEEQPAASVSGSSQQDSLQDNWVELYRRSRDVRANWRAGRSTVAMLDGHGDFIRCLQLAGDTLVSCSGSISHSDCSIRVWDVQEGTCHQLLRGHMGPIWCMMYEPSMRRIASGSDDYTVRYWDSVTGNSVVMQDPDSAVRCIHMDGGRRQLVAGTEFGRLLLWDMNQLEDVLSRAVDRMVAEFERRALDASPSLARNGGTPTSGSGLTPEQLLDGRHVVVDGSNHVRVVDAAEEGKAISAIQVQDGLCASTSVEPLSRIQLWDVSRNCWAPAGTLGEPDMMYANSLSFDKRLGWLVAGCGDRNVRVWDLNTGARLHLLSGHSEQVHAHQFDATTLATAALDGQVRVWDMRSGTCAHVLRHAAPVHAFQYHGDNLVSGTWDGRVCLWDMRRGALVKEWASHTERVWAVAIDGYHVASGGLDHRLCVRSFLPPRLNPALAAPPLPRTESANALPVAACRAASSTSSSQGSAQVPDGVVSDEGVVGSLTENPAGVSSSPSTSSADTARGPFSGASSEALDER